MNSLQDIQLDLWLHGKPANQQEGYSPLIFSARLYTKGLTLKQRWAISCSRRRNIIFSDKIYSELKLLESESLKSKKAVIKQFWSDIFI